LFQVIYRLNGQLEDLESTISKLRERDQEIFQKCIGAQVTKDIPHAIVYANECVEIRKVVKLAISSQIALERATIRLQRIAEFKDVMAYLVPVMGILNETENRISDFVPEVATGIGEVNSMLNELSSQVEIPSSKNSEETTPNEEVKKVLEESNVLAEQKLKEQFPELPELEALSKRTSEPEPVALTNEGEEVALHELVYSHLKERDGDLSISQCAYLLGVSQEHVRKAIEHLEKTGRVVIDKRSV